MNEQTGINNDTAQSTMTKKVRMIPAVILAVIISVIVFLLLLLPFIKTRKAKNHILNNENEKAIRELYGILPVFGAKELKEQANSNIAEDIVEIIQKEHPRFSKDVFVVKSIYDFTNSIEDDSEDISFKVDFVNDRCTATAECIAHKTLIDSEWIMDGYNIGSVEYNISDTCDRQIADDHIAKLYPDAVLKEESGDGSDLYHSFIYTSKVISPADPFVNDIKQIDVVCTYKPAENRWSVTDVNEKIISQEEIPLKEFITPEYTFLLPESWYMRTYNYSYTYERDGQHIVNGDVSYTWFANKEDAMAYNDKDGGADILSIRINYSNDTQEYIPDSEYYSDIERIQVPAFGNGYITYYTYNDTKYYSTTFNSTLHGYNSHISVYKLGTIDKEKLLGVLNNIKREKNNIIVEVLVKNLNIRDYPSTFSQVVGSVSAGRTFKVIGMSDDYQGYRWYQIAEEQWIADLDGQYLKVTYN